MKSRDRICLLLLNICTLNVFAQYIPTVPMITPKPMPMNALPIPSQSTPPLVPSISTIPASFYSTTTIPHGWNNVLSAADYLLEELNEHLHIDLRKRQGVAPAGAPQAATSVVTQMSPVTTYGPQWGWPSEVYTQLFVAVPDQWSSASAGTIGLGTIQGTVGVVKTNSKRYAVPEPTAQVIRIKGREVTVSG